MSKHIFWISSYPKSGNTLIRAILSSLFFSNNGKFELKNIKHISQFEMSQRLNIIEKLNKEDFKNLNNLQILSKYWQIVQSKENLNVKGDFLFLKTHSCLVSINKNFFTSEKITKGYIYLIRDPRDVCISWAKHTNLTIDQSIDFILNNYSCIEWSNKVKQSNVPKTLIPLNFLSSWGEHVKSWTNNDWSVPKLFIRYEDLINDKKKIIIEIQKFLLLNYNIEISNFDLKIKNIIETTNFKNMKLMEEKHGFDESTNGKFFRKGTQNQWKDLLTIDQINKIEKNCKEYMLRFNYEIN